jgi:methionyl-tRNA formyltransferase
VTQPDRPTGRKQEIQMSRVKIVALKYHIPIDQPATLKEYTVPVEADINLVCKYGLIIPEKILYRPRYGSINVHASLLPKYRGASPIQSALIHGDIETGVTIMQMDKAMDHGAILSQQTVEILPDDTCETLSERLAPTEAETLIKTVPKYIAGEIKPVEQNHELATFCREFKREDGEIKLDKTATEIYNLYRGLTPWPGIWTMWNGKRLKLLKIKPVNESAPAGKIIAKNNKLLVGCADNTTIEILELQLEGKAMTEAKNFINGFKNLLE